MVGKNTFQTQAVYLTATRPPNTQVVPATLGRGAPRVPGAPRAPGAPVAPGAQACLARLVRRKRHVLHVRQVYRMFQPRHVGHVRCTPRVCQVRLHTSGNMSAPTTPVEKQCTTATNINMT
eukprot:3839661-Pyramimonas_sp.AAC.1